MSKNADTRPTPVELQDDIMRFEGRFSSRLNTAFRPLLEADDAAVRAQAQRDLLSYMSSALDIAVSTNPDVDLLDMVTLLTLGAEAMERRWSLEAHGDAARGVHAAFATSRDEISDIARAVVSDDVATELTKVIGEWRRENPDSEDVSSVRLSVYADSRRSGGANQAAGLFSVVRGAAQTADTAVLLGERALYAAQRMPFLIRMHARVASTDLVTDVERNLSALVAPSSRSRGLAQRVTQLASGAEGSINRILRNMFLACSGIAVVAASSWLFARVVHHRATAR